MFKFFTRFSKKSNNLFYITNGTEILPEKLTSSEESLLVLEMKNGSEMAKNQLIERNLRLVVYTAQKFENTNVSIEDLISIGTIGLIKAVGSFKGEKNIKLATYASRCIENEILMHLRKVSKQKREVSLDEPLNSDAEGNELCISDILSSGENEVTKDLDKADEMSNLHIILDKLSKKEKEIMNMRYGLLGGEEMTQKEVADYFDISQTVEESTKNENMMLLSGHAELKELPGTVVYTEIKYRAEYSIVNDGKITSMINNDQINNQTTINQSYLIDKIEGVDHTGTAKFTVYDYYILYEKNIETE